MPVHKCIPFFFLSGQFLTPPPALSQWPLFCGFPYCIGGGGRNRQTSEAAFMGDIDNDNARMADPADIDPDPTLAEKLDPDRIFQFWGFQALKCLRFDLLKIITISSEIKFFILF